MYIDRRPGDTGKFESLNRDLGYVGYRRPVGIFNFLHGPCI
jgi:hypothetical protein